jgi:glucosylglycerate synthase
MPSTVLTPTVRDQIARLGKADIMVGIPSFKNAATIGYVVRAAQAGLVQYFPDLRPVVVNSDAGSPDGTGRVVIETEPPDYVEQILLTRPNHKLERVSLTYPEIDGVGGKGAALRTIFEIAAALEVQALVVVDSDLRSIVPEWIELLSGPILKGGYDFVAPLYARYKYDGTITNTVTYPLTRALYGHRIRQPIGGDFGVSGDLVRHYLTLDDWTDDVSKFGIDIWMTTSALTGGFAVCQTRLGAKIHDPKDPGSDLGPMFRQVVGTILRLAVRNADEWLTIRGSHSVPAYGFERMIDPPPLEVNTLRLLSEFHAGSLTLTEMWRSMLSPESLEAVLELAAEAGRLGDAARARLGIGGDVASTTATTLEMAEAASTFHFPDDLWAKVVYDLVVTARNPSHPLESLVAALVPIYFGRVGSFVIENRHITTEQAEERVERQAREFELLKPYLAQRWTAATDSSDGSAATDGKGGA